MFSQVDYSHVSCNALDASCVHGQRAIARAQPIDRVHWIADLRRVVDPPNIRECACAWRGAGTYMQCSTIIIASDTDKIVSAIDVRVDRIYQLHVAT